MYSKDYTGNICNTLISELEKQSVLFFNIGIKGSSCVIGKKSHLNDLYDIETMYEIIISYSKQQKHLQK